MQLRDNTQFERLSAGHGVLTAVRTGAGRDLVLLHPLLADRTAFDAVLPALAPKFRVTLFNLPGFDGSEPVIMPLVDAYVARLEDGFREFDIGSDAILLGSGFGGTLALAFALDHPERIAKLIVSAAAAGFPDASRQAFSHMAETVGEGGLSSIADMAVKRMYSAAYLAANPAKIEEHKRVLSRIDPKAFQDACKILREVDLVPLLHRLRTPTLIICGEHDRTTPPALAKSIAEKVANAKYVELPGCGHCPPLEQPQPFLAAIEEFVGL